MQDPSCNAKKTVKAKSKKHVDADAKAKKHVKKFMHSKEFKDEVGKAVEKAVTVALENTVSAAVEKATAAAFETMMKLQRLDHIHKKASNVLNAYAQTADGASEHEQHMLAQALGDLTCIKLKRKEAIENGMSG